MRQVKKTTILFLTTASLVFLILLPLILSNRQNSKLVNRERKFSKNESVIKNSKFSSNFSRFILYNKASYNIYSNSGDSTKNSYTSRLNIKYSHKKINNIFLENYKFIDSLYGTNYSQTRINPKHIYMGEILLDSNQPNKNILTLQTRLTDTTNLTIDSSTKKFYDFEIQISKHKKINDKKCLEKIIEYWDLSKNLDVFKKNNIRNINVVYAIIKEKKEKIYVYTFHDGNYVYVGTSLNENFENIVNDDNSSITKK